ncbi:hypothetical protein JY651_50525 [Pyxidicoccus parkwayensis]|uniref:Uncharacterized protein n=1 Tax=Pyxidicoccus parkwayensis TaxID=2813578 RepID=A0ABX7P0I4_9BACT|nr:hypothetical protein [Pyxidicoccus parkwaysis]QSQ23227.1 hypothetical protein JY651_50525 [Pyxidicoccus parkwaysis]
MSTASDIVDGISRLIQALDELFKTQTVEALVDLVRQLGIGGPVKQGLQALGTVLGKLVEWIAKLEKVAAIPKMLEALDPSLQQAQSLAESSEDDLRQAGLDALVPLTKAARAMLDVMNKVRKGAEAILRGLLPPEALARLRQSVVDFAATLKSYEERLVTEPPKKAVTPGKTSTAGTLKPALAGGTS